MRFRWIAGWLLALAASALVAFLFRGSEPPQAKPDRPEWASLTTGELTATAQNCYRREAAWQATAYCASPVADVLEIVWASCFAEEKELLLASIVDSQDDQTAMDYLAGIEATSSAEVTEEIEETRAKAGKCTGLTAKSVSR
jgi:hypothetical protein